MITNILRRLWHDVLPPGRRVRLGLMLRHRRQGYEHLDGCGIEIGALHIPARLPRRCRTVYADAISREEAAKLFPELNPGQFVPVSLIVDLDGTGLAGIESDHFDYAILNHVIEHVANPIRTIGELFRVVRPGGHVVVSVPDKRFTFDRPRHLTSFDHLRAEFEESASSVSDDHYRDFVLATQGPHLSVDELNAQIAGARQRREHAHVWTSDSFADFMRMSLDLLHVHAEPIFVSDATTNRYEYFSVWKKLATSSDEPIQLS